MFLSPNIKKVTTFYEKGILLLPKRDTPFTEKGYSFYQKGMPLFTEGCLTLIINKIASSQIASQKTLFFIVVLLIINYPLPLILSKKSYFCAIKNEHENLITY